MALRRGHGAGKNALVRVEQAEAHELPPGISEDTVGVDPPTPLAGEEARISPQYRPGVMTPQKKKASPEDFQRWGAAGGRQQKIKSQIVEMLGFNDYAHDHPYFKYWCFAREFRAAESSRLIRQVGGGELGAGPAAIVAAAARQMAASLWYTDQGNHLDASKLANDARQNLLAAHELAARAAKTTPRKPKVFDVPGVEVPRAPARTYATGPVPALPPFQGPPR